MSEIEAMIDNLVRSCIEYGRYNTNYNIEYEVNDLLELIKSKLKEEECNEQ